MASSYAGNGSGRGKRRVTVVLHSDPLAELQSTSAAATSAGSTSPASRGPPHRRRSANPPPISSLELLRVALQSVVMSETAPMLTLSTLHDAAVGWLHDACATDSANTVVPSDAAGGRAGPDDQGFMSLDDDEDDGFSDRETSSLTRVSTTRVSRRQPPRTAEEAPLPAGACDTACATTVPLMFHSRNFAASLTFMKAAVHCLSCEESRFLRMSVALAEQACLALPTTRSRALLAWCCVRYAEVCADVTLQRSLEDLAMESLGMAEMGLGGGGGGGDATGTVSDESERLHLHEVQAWCYALLGAHAQALQHAEEAMRMSFRNASTVCLAALLRTSQGDLAGAETLLLWLIKEQPHHTVAKGLLALVWSQQAASQSTVDASERDDDVREEQHKQDIDGLLVALTTEARQLAAYARGTRDFGAAAQSSVVPPVASPTAGGSVGHMDANWSCIPRISNKVAHTFLFASCVAGRLRRHDLADALHTATLEWLAEAAATDGGSVSLTLSAPFAADVLKQQAVLAADGATGGGTRQSKELLEQSYALFPSGDAAMIAGCLHLHNSARGSASSRGAPEAQEEAQAWFERALQSNPVDACALQGVAWGKAAQNDWQSAVELLLSAASSELQQPVLPYKALMPWADLF